MITHSDLKSEGNKLSQNELPLVSIIMPTFNRPEYLDETIQSILNQTFTRWELIVIDDGSDLQTLNKLSEYSLKFSQIQFYQRDGQLKGACVCRNQGLAKAKGEFVIFMDSDDLLESTCLENRVKFFQLYPKAELIGLYVPVFETSRESFKFMWNIFNEESMLERLLRNDTLFQSMTLTWRTESIKQINGWNENLHYRQDWELQTRAFAAGLNIVAIPYIDCYYRYISTNQISKKIRDKSHRNEYIGMLKGIESIFLVLKNSKSYSDKHRRLLQSTFIRITQNDYPSLFVVDLMKFMLGSLFTGFFTIKEFFIIKSYLFLFEFKIRGKLIKKIRNYLPPYTEMQSISTTRLKAPVLKEYFDLNHALKNLTIIFSKNSLS